MFLTLLNLFIAFYISKITYIYNILKYKVWAIYDYQLLKKRMCFRNLTELLVILVLLKTYESCRINQCSREYSSILEVTHQSPHQQSSTTNEQYCNLLNTFQNCLRELTRSCRGNLEFHSMQTLSKHRMVLHNCTNEVSPNNQCYVIFSSAINFANISFLFLLGCGCSSSHYLKDFSI